MNAACSWSAVMVSSSARHVRPPGLDPVGNGTERGRHVRQAREDDELPVPLAVRMEGDIFRVLNKHLFPVLQLEKERVERHRPQQAPDLGTNHLDTHGKPPSLPGSPPGWFLFHP